MTVVEEASPLLIAIFLLSLVAAAVVDIRYRRIPNTPVLAIALSGVIAFASTGHAALLWQPLLVTIAILVIGISMFARGWLGGGDVKLLAASATWFTASAALQFVAFVLLAGGILALIALAWRMVRGKRSSRQAEAGLPYAVAITSGAFAQLIL